MRRTVTAIVLVFGMWSPASATETRIELVTVGRGDSLFSRFGHAVLCVFSDTYPDGECFNYGAARARPGLARDVVLGVAEFVVKPEPYSYVLGYYRERNREVVTQRLPLGSEEAERISARLHTDSLLANREYQYDPLRDNCSTRIRDVIDEGTNGRLKRSTSRERTIWRYRQEFRTALAERTWLLCSLDLVMGGADTRLSGWDSMFSPIALRQQVGQVFGAIPAVVHEGSISPRSPSWIDGRWPPLAAAVLLFVLGLFTGRIGSWTRAAGFAFCGLVLTVPAVLVYLFAIASMLPEARHNLALVLFLPSDVVLVLAPPLCRADRPRLVNLLRRYMTFRVVLVGLLGLSTIPQWVRPSLLPWLVLAAAALGGPRLGLESGEWRAPQPSVELPKSRSSQSRKKRSRRRPKRGRRR